MPRGGIYNALVVHKVLRGLLSKVVHDADLLGLDSRLASPGNLVFT